jgi:hypothetical protein
MGITDYNRIFLFADVKKEKDEGRHLTLVLTDRTLLVTYNLVDVPFMIKIRDVKECNVYLQHGMYVVLFVMMNGKTEGFRIFEQKVACRIFDMFKQVSNGVIDLNYNKRREEVVNDDYYDALNFSF